MLRLDWVEIRDLSITTKTPLRYVDRGALYFITLENWAYCKLAKDDASEFDSDFKPYANPPFDVKDKDGASVVNPKLATEGRSYQSMFAALTTAKYNGVTAKDENNQNDTQFVCKIYDANGDEITSSANESQAVLTTVEWEPTVAYDIQGFCLYQKTQPTTDIFLSAISAHHIPAAYGGSKVAIKGCNLRFAPYGAIESDWVGDSTSAIALDTTYYSHHQILKLYHNAGVQHEAMLEVIWYV